MRRRPFQLILLLALAALAWRPAHAESDKQVAQRAYAEGKRLYDVGEYPRALAAFKRAYLAYEEPSLLFNMAQCYRLIGDKHEAIQSYKSYLRNLPEARNREEVKRIIADLETALAQEREAAAAQAKAMARPPQGTMTPEHTTQPEPAPATAPAALTLTRTADAPAPKRKRYWWAWTVGGVLIAGAAVGVAVGVTQGRASEPSLNKVQFP